MPVYMNPSELHVKNPNGNGYLPQNTVSQHSVEDVQAAGASQVSAVNSAGATQVAAINTKAGEVTAQLANAGEMEDMVAGAFSTSKAYKAGDYVIYTTNNVNKLYRFNVDHAAGAWNSAQVSEVKLGDETSSLKSAFDHIIDGEYTKDWSNYSRGTLNSGVPGGNNSRVYLTDITHAGAVPIKLRVLSGFKFVLAYYYENGNYRTETGWINSDSYQILEPNSYFRVVIARDPETTAVANISEFAGKMVFQTFDNTCAESYLKKFCWLYDKTAFQRGSLNESGAIVAYNARVLSTDIISFPMPVLLTCDQDYLILVGKYNGETYLGYENWSKQVIIEANTQFRVVITHDPEASGYANVAEYSSKVMAITSASAIINKMNAEILDNKYESKLAAVKCPFSAILDTVNKKFWFPRGAEVVVGNTTYVIGASQYDISSAINSSSLIKIYYNTSNNSIVAYTYNTSVDKNQYILLAIVTFYKNQYTIGYGPGVCALFDVEIDPFSKPGQGYANGIANNPTILATKGICHMGYSNYGEISPESSVASVVLAKEHGFDYVEVDVRMTSDNIPVMIHDGTINRIARDANGDELPEPIYVYNNTYETLNQYDYGIRTSETYRGYKLNTLEEILDAAKSVGLHIILELKGNDMGETESAFSAEQLLIIANAIHKYGMDDAVSYASFNFNNLTGMRMINDRARLIIINQQSNYSITYQNAALLLTGKNQVWLDFDITKITETIVDDCKAHNFPLLLWTTDDKELMKAQNPYVTGITSNLYNYSDVLKEKYIN